MIKLSKMHKRLLALSAVMPLAAIAQEAQPEAGKLEVVTVTAQRRAENIREVPVSVSMIKDEKLDILLSGGQDIRVLAGKTPSLNIESSTGRVFPRFYIRGYGNADFSVFASQPVSLIYDDIVQENPILKGFPMFDLAGVEVLRGPQGTLFGRQAFAEGHRGLLQPVLRHPRHRQYRRRGQYSAVEGMGNARFHAARPP